MTYDDLIKKFGSPAAAAEALGKDRQLLHGWYKRGRIPLDQQVDIEVQTGGELRADLPDAVRAQAQARP